MGRNHWFCDLVLQFHDVKEYIVDTELQNILWMARKQQSIYLQEMWIDMIIAAELQYMAADRSWKFGHPNLFGWCSLAHM